MITGPAGRPTSRVRLDGYRAALDRAGITLDLGLIRHGGYSHEPAYQASLELLRLPGRLINGAEPETPRVDLATRLVVRESTGPVP